MNETDPRTGIFDSTKPGQYNRVIMCRVYANDRIRLPCPTSIQAVAMLYNITAPGRVQAFRVASCGVDSKKRRLVSKDTFAPKYSAVPAGRRQRNLSLPFDICVGANLLLAYIQEFCWRTLTWRKTAMQSPGPDAAWWLRARGRIHPPVDPSWPLSLPV